MSNEAKPLVFCYYTDVDNKKIYWATRRKEYNACSEVVELIREDDPEFDSSYSISNIETYERSVVGFIYVELEDRSTIVTMRETYNIKRLERDIETTKTLDYEDAEYVNHKIIQVEDRDYGYWTF